MQIISDIANNKSLIEKILKKHGCSAEHNYYCYLYNIESWEDPYVFIFDEEYLILAKYDRHDNDWYLAEEPAAPGDKKASLIMQVVEYAFSKNTRKVWLELELESRESLLKSLKDSDYKSNKIAYSLTWPVYKMDVWSGEKMEGKDWKDIRYYWNKFFRDHKVEFVSSDKADKEEMKNLVYEWKKKRTTGDRAYIEYYIHAIDTDFKGYDSNRIMIVDGKVAAITAGFEARKGYYYSSIGLFEKDIDRCNEIANMDDLINLKKLGYEFVDFGGVEEKSLEFKKKFRPTYFYKTRIFSIVPRK